MEAVIDKIAKRVSRRLLLHGQIEQDNFELYVYGFREGIILVINFISSMIIASFFSQLLENIVFLLTYCVLRQYAGGYHAATRRDCYVRSLLLIVMVMIMIRFVYIPFRMGMIASIGAIVCIWFVSPVENIKKPITCGEREKYRGLSRKIVLLEMGITVILHQLQLYTLAQSMLWGVWLVSLLQVIVLVQNWMK